MTTLNPTLTRRAFERLTTAGAEETAGVVQPHRYTWLRVALPVPADADSRRATTTLSTSVRTDLPRVLDIAGLVAAASAFVALLSVVCR